MGSISPLWVPAVAAYLSVAWAAVFHRLWGRRRYGLASLDYWSSCGGFVALALMITLPLPPVVAESERLTGRVGLADALADVAALLALLAWLVYLSRLVPPHERWLIDRRHSRWIPWHALLVGLFITGALLGARVALLPGHLGFRLGPHPDAARCLATVAHLVYRLACLAQLGLVILVLRRLAEVVGQRPVLQARLRAIRWVLWYMILYIGYEIASAFFWPLPDLSSRIFRMRSLLLLAAIVAPDRWYLVGLAFARRLSTTATRQVSVLREWRACRRLYPLWAALYPVQPRISYLVAPPNPTGTWYPEQATTIALCRMVMEIRDWDIKLWPYREPHAADVALAITREAGSCVADQTALVKAVELAAALANWRASRTSYARRSDLSLDERITGGITLAEEVAQLLPIADAFAHSPLVRVALARIDSEVSLHSDSEGSSRHTASVA